MNLEFLLQLFKSEGTNLGFSVGLKNKECNDSGIYVQEIQSNRTKGM